MLRFILELTFWQGIVLTASIIVISGILVILTTKKFLSPYIEKQHEKIGRLLFRVSASLIAFLISLSYANERVAQSKIVDAMEEEASIVGSTFFLLDELDSEDAEIIEEKLAKYVILTIEDNWETIDTNPYFSDGPQTLKAAYFATLRMTTENAKERIIQSKLLSNFDEIIRLMQVRIYSNHALMPNLVYILCIGMFFMWIFYTVYRIDVISLGFITLYNLFLGILIYFVLALSNPLVGPLKINAHAFEVIQEKGIEAQIN